jgi:hypothetical protein
VACAQPGWAGVGEKQESRGSFTYFVTAEDQTLAHAVATFKWPYARLRISVRLT